MTTRQRQGAGSPQTAAYRALIAIAEEVVASARMALDDTAAMRGKDVLTALKIEALREEIAHYCDLGARVIDQARRRVLDGEQVPTSEKIYSIFEPHTDLIKRGKVRTPVEFGHKVCRALRFVRCRRGARQQSHDRRRTVGPTLQAPTQTDTTIISRQRQWNKATPLPHVARRNSSWRAPTNVENHERKTWHTQPQSVKVMPNPSP